MINIESIQINPAFVLRTIYNVKFLIPVRKNTITTEAIHLNNTAALIFELCSLAKSPEELASIVAKQFVDIDEVTAKNRLLPYIISYIEQGILEFGHCETHNN